MELVDFRRPGEKKKVIWAGVLGFVAILFLWWTFVGFGSRNTTPSRTAATSSNLGNRNPQSTRPAAAPDTPQVISINDLQSIVLSTSLPKVPEPRRNIFAYSEKPVVEKPATVTALPSPTPTPPVLLAGISPSNVYAKTADFTLELSGDKFSPEMRVYVDDREVPTKYKGPQQISASVAAAIIANPGVRQITVRTPDSRLYSAQVGLSVAPPPTPNYSYVGIFGTMHHVDTALLQDKNNKEILSVQRGDLLSGRFRVTSISEKEVVFVDANLKIKHTLAMTEGERAGGSPSARPTPKVDAEDDEP
jgi:hypothetical protein